MNVEDIIRQNRAYGKKLSGIGFTVSTKGKNIIVKFGKKLNIIPAPSKEAAQELADGFNATIKRNHEKIEEFIDLMQQHCQQISLFHPIKEDHVETTGTCDKS